jgi:3-dehydroquinate synthase
VRDLKIIDSGFYPIYIGENIYYTLNNFIQLDRYKKSRFFILVDENSHKHCLPRLNEKVSFLQNAKVVTIPPGEQHKNISTCAYIWNFLTRENADRHSVLLNLGGGVVTDMGGFAAATFKRGIRYINVPTTLTGQIDAAIGGKVGIDHENLKNLIGVFKNPQAVLIDPDFLETLPDEDMVSGFAEIIKYGLISDATFWYFISKVSFDEHSDWQQLISRSVEIKSSVVKVDPVERKYRKVLNFGHTIGHAIESTILEAGAKPVSHGKAVATGMICATYISEKKLNLSRASAMQVYHYIKENIGILPGLAAYRERIFDFVLNDKKNEGDKVLFTLLAGLGHAIINQEVNREMIENALDFCIDLEGSHDG